MINLGQIGIGVWGQNLLRNFSGLPGCSMKICCDKNKFLLEKARLSYNNKLKVTVNFDDLLKDPQLDAIVVATLPATHAYFTIKALSCGKHVFVEKPLALKLDDAIQMIKAARRYKKILMVGHLLLYHPAIQKLKSYINDGLLGNLQYLYSTRVNLGQVRSEENALWSLTAHDISVANYLLGKNPTCVRASGKSYIRKNIEDVVFLTIEFKSNVIAHIHASWLDPHKIRKFTIVGSKKMAVFDDMESSEKIRIYDKGFEWERNYGNYETFLTLREGDILIPKIDMKEPLKLECLHFVDCISKNKKPISGGENGLDVLRVLDAAQRSLEDNGKAIKI